MKKFMVCALLTGAFLIAACGSDDDGDGENNSNDTCMKCTNADNVIRQFCLKRRWGYCRNFSR